MPSTKHEPDTEARILEAAHRVFLQKGTGGARMQEIADEAGVNKALLHYYFRSKERLTEKVYVSTASKLFPTMVQVLASQLPLREKIAALVTAQLDQMEANPYLPGYVLAEFQYNPDSIRAALEPVMPPLEMRQMVLTILQKQLDGLASAGQIRTTRAYDFILTVLGQTIFPIVVAPMIDFVWGTGRDERASFLRYQRETLAERIMQSLTP